MMSARKDQPSACSCLLLRSVENVAVVERKHRVNQEPRLNHRQRRHEQMQSGDPLERPVLPENQNHCQQAHAGGDDDEDENQGSA